MHKVPEAERSQAIPWLLFNNLLRKAQCTGQAAIFTVRSNAC